MSAWNFQGRRGQLSIEYLILSAAFLAFLLLLLGPLEQAFDAAVFSIDVIAAEKFSGDLSVALRELNLSGTGSSKSLSAKALANWQLTCNPDGVTLEVFSEKTGRSKKTVAPVHSGVVTCNGMSLAKNFTITVSKEDTGLVINADSYAP